MPDNYELLRKRLNALGGNADQRIQRDKLNSLTGALKYSYQAETIVLNGQTMRALINNNKLKMDYDDKIISIPFSSQIKVGDTFLWNRTNENWIVYLQHLSEDAYFRGYIRKAAHTIKWKDEYGNVHECFAAIRGPVETKIRTQVKSGLAFDEPNYTLNMVIPQNEDTAKLQRYSKIMLNGKVWEVAAADDISEPGVIDMNLIEDYKNMIEDSNDVVGGNIEREANVESCLDNIEEIELNTPIELWTDVVLNGKHSSDLIENAKYEIKSGFGYFEGNNLILSQLGTVEILLTIPKLKFSKVFNITVTETLVQNAIDIDIVGSTLVKSFGSTTYTIVKYINGQRVEPQGTWSFNNNNNLFKVENKTNTSIQFNWISGKTGTLTLEYNDIDGTEKIEIKVESLL